MKSHVAIIVGLCALPASARADWLMLQKVEGMGQAPVEMSIKVQGDKFRMDLESMGMTMIMDATTGDVMNIDHSGKMIMRIKKADMDALAGTISAQVPKNQPKQKLEATGRTERINGYKADEYTWNMGDGTVASYWIVRDFPDYKQLAVALERMQNLGPISAMKDLSPKVSDFPGMPIRTVMETQGRKVETNVISLTKQSFPASDFKAPGGYKEMAIPQMGGAQSPPVEGQ
jgi:hypothetical protein